MDPAQKVEQQGYSRQKKMNAVIGQFSSPVQQFYSGATVFITGGSGFMGKHLIEKIFRSCQIKRMYLLLRPKKGKQLNERLELLLSDPVFVHLREQQPDFASRLVPVQGDTSELKLGISQTNWHKLTEEVNIIFHMAATISFDEPLRVATLINVRGTREAIQLAKHCRNLKKFIHVSTAYVQATHSKAGQKLYEEFGETPVPPDVMISLAETLEESRLKNITAALIEDWPNTYTFTKAIAEELVRRAGSNLPICIVRPAIVVCSYTEPCPGWLQPSCVFGPSGSIFGIGIGGLKTVFVDENMHLPLVPVDYVNNAIIATAWDSSLEKGGGDVPIYTVGTEEAAFQWTFIAKCFRSEDFRRLLSPKTFWYAQATETSNWVYFWLLTWLWHYIPAYIGDAVVTLFRIQMPKGMPSFVKLVDKVGKFSEIYKHFLTKEYLFQDQNIKKMAARMSDKDRVIFNCDLRDINKIEFLKIWVVGVRKYIVKDGLIGSEKAYRKQFYFRIVHYLVVCLYAFIFYKLFIFVYKCMTSFYDIL